MLDPAQGRITVFGPDGRFLVHAPWRDLFFVHDAGGRRSAAFGRILPDQETRSLVLQGEIAPAGPGEFVYAPYQAGYLAKLDQSTRTMPTRSPR